MYFFPSNYEFCFFLFFFEIHFHIKYINRRIYLWPCGLSLSLLIYISHYLYLYLSIYLCVCVNIRQTGVCSCELNEIVINISLSLSHIWHSSITTSSITFFSFLGLNFVVLFCFWKFVVIEINNDNR